jgi:hypothetical protein
MPKMATYGAILALREAGKKAGGKDGVVINFFDADRLSSKMFLKDQINVNAARNPLHGPKVFRDHSNA